MTEIKQVIVVRSDLKMGKGKIAAQVAHAALDAAEASRNKHAGWYESWREQGQAKVVVKTDGGESALQELQKQARSLGLAGLAHPGQRLDPGRARDHDLPWDRAGTLRRDRQGDRRIEAALKMTADAQPPLIDVESGLLTYSTRGPRTGRQLEDELQRLPGRGAHISRGGRPDKGARPRPGLQGDQGRRRHPARRQGDRGDDQERGQLRRPEGQERDGRPIRQREEHEGVRSRGAARGASSRPS